MRNLSFYEGTTTMSIAEASILLVDDEESIRKSLARELELEQFTVSTVANGSEAIKALENWEYDLVITDLMMPGVNGLKVLEVVKKANALTSVIILTGYGDMQSAVEALRLGADDFVRKPFDIEELVYRIQHCLEKRNLLLERKRAENAFQENEEKFRTLANFAYAMEAWMLPDGTYRYISPSCERVTGYAATEFLKDPNFFVQITHLDDKARVIEHYSEAFHETNRHNMGLDFRILTPEGEVRWISHSCTAVHGEGGQWQGRRQSFREITNCKQMEDALRKSESFNRQFQKNESLKRMARAIAHVFNNQLGAVIGNLELAIQDLPLDAEPATRVAGAIQAAFKAAEVSGLMNTYLGCATGKHAPLSLFELCRNNLPLLQAASTKGLILDVDLSSPDPVVNGDANQIKQVLVNLVTNAWEALGESHGDINLTLKTVSPGDVAEAHRFPFDWEAQNVPYACLEVKDTGCGIAKEDIDTIFDPFYSRKFTGRGLGLPVALGIIKAHDGAIVVETETGRGSVFRVLLPISSEVVPIQLNKAAQLLTGEWVGTVLLVEDEKFMRERTKILLEQLGFTVLMARNSVEAKSIYRKSQGEIHCVICDFKMTPHNGYEIFNALRQINPGVKFIISSGYDKGEIFACFAGQGLNGFIQKPFSQKDFAAEVLEVLEKEERIVA